MISLEPDYGTAMMARRRAAFIRASLEEDGPENFKNLHTKKILAMVLLAGKLGGSNPHSRAGDQISSLISGKKRRQSGRHARWCDVLSFASSEKLCDASFLTQGAHPSRHVASAGSDIPDAVVQPLRKVLMQAVAANGASF